MWSACNTEFCWIYLIVFISSGHHAPPALVCSVWWLRAYHYKKRKMERWSIKYDRIIKDRQWHNKIVIINVPSCNFRWKTCAKTTFHRGKENKITQAYNWTRSTISHFPYSSTQVTIGLSTCSPQCAVKLMNSLFVCAVDLGRSTEPAQFSRQRHAVNPTWLQIPGILFHCRRLWASVLLSHTWDTWHCKRGNMTPPRAASRAKRSWGSFFWDMHLLIIDILSKLLKSTKTNTCCAPVAPNYPLPLN